MKKTTIIIAIVLIISFGIYYISSNNNSRLTPASNTPSTLAPESISVNIKNFSFNPSTLTIKTGAKVTWINNDTVSHTVTSDDGNLLDSRNLSPGQSFSFVFTNSGAVNYHCEIHPTMKGIVVVEN
ncbi:MAG: Blue (Type 1) copper domain protein [Parcubacteria group bacterium GW2011_GWC1_40_13]|nr:MAG: Blue (Type 1) copper domain protein [Parcubacteria group bacterium GW2011_GWC1_40_13]